MNTILEYCNQMLLLVGMVFIFAGIILYVFHQKSLMVCMDIELHHQCKINKNGILLKHTAAK